MSDYAEGNDLLQWCATYPDDAAIEIERLRARVTEAETLLKDPTAVHLNMLCGAIAKPSWLNIRHLYPDEFAKLDEESDRYRRNRDMWRGQCARQAERLTLLTSSIKE